MWVSQLQVWCDFLSPVATPYPFARCHGFLRVFYSDFYFIFYNCNFILFIKFFCISYSSYEGTSAHQQFFNSCHVSVTHWHHINHYDKQLEWSTMTEEGREKGKKGQETSLTMSIGLQVCFFFFFDFLNLLLYTFTNQQVHPLTTPCPTTNESS